MRLQLVAFSSLLVAVVAQNDVVKCGGSWQQLGDRCFLAVAGTNREWKDARSDCRTRSGADLAVIPDQATSTFLQTMLTGVTSVYWIGLHDLPNENDFRWVDGRSLVDTNFTNWAQNEPDNGWLFDEDCVTFDPLTGEWNDDWCDFSVRPYVCERNSSSIPKCDESHGWQSYNGKCYQFFYDYQPWQSAQDICSFYKDGHIAYVKSPEDQAFLDDLQMMHGFAYWIGLQDGSTDGEYKWTDNTIFDKTNDYSNWKSGQPDNKWYGQQGDCGKVATSGLWTIDRCNKRIDYVCEIPEGACAPGWYLVSGNCYQVNSKTLRTWTDAKQYCEAQLAFLTVIKSDAENLLIKSFLGDLNSQGINEVFIGASDLETDGTYVWVDGTSATGQYTHWVTGQPPSPDQKKDCAYIDTADSLDGQWRAGDCFMLGAYVCQTKAGHKVESVPSTPITDHCDGPTWDLHKGYCYEIVLTRESWADADTKCKALGAELVSVHSDDEQSFMSVRINVANERIWMGLNDKASEGSFVWTDQSNFDYNNWADPTAIGSNDCVSMEGHTTSYGLWKTRSCSESNYYACKKKAVKGSPVTSIPPTIIYDTLCGSGWEFDKKSGRCYYFQPFEKVNWFEARYQCRLLGGDLMSLSTNDELAYATSRLMTTGGGESWIGCNDLGTEGGWVWSNKKPFSLLNWNPGQPDNWFGDKQIGEHCCNIYNDKGTWNDNFCENQLGYSCNKDDLVLKFFVTYSEKKLTGAPDSMVVPNAWPLDCAEKCLALPTNTFYCKSFDYERATRTCYLYKVDQATAGGLIPTFDTQHFDHYERDLFAPIDPQPTPIPANKRCPAGWGQYREYCYYANFNRTDFAGAQAQCQGLGAELTTIHDINVNNFVRAFVYEQNQNENRFWIGLTDQKQEMLYEWYNGEPVVFTNWNAKEPNDVFLEDCTELYIDSGFWNDVPCQGTAYNSICRKVVSTGNPPPPLDTSCPTGGTWNYKWRDRCYQIELFKLSWEDAANRCTTTPGAQLVVIEDRMELAYLSGALGSLYTTDDYFIALSDSKVPGYYQWMDSSPITYTNWAEGQPDDQQGHCVAVNSGKEAGYWADRDCTQKHNFVCEKARGGFPTIPPPAVVTPTPPTDKDCSTGWVGWGNRCFQIFEFDSDADAVNWDTAKSRCDDMGASLASFHHPDEEKYLTSKLSPTTDRQFWIGLNDQRFEGGYAWSDGSPVEYTNWGAGEPNDYGGTEECVETNFKGGKWNDQGCWDARNFICFIMKGKTVITTPPPTIPTGADCPGFPEWQHLNPNCYYFSTRQDGLKDWHEAEEFCHNEGAHLVSIHTTDERNFVRDRMEMLVGNYWCGLRANISHPGNHEWSDGTLLDLKDWLPSQPDTNNGEELCVQMKGNELFPFRAAKWLDANCGLAARFVCKKNVDGTAPTHEPTNTPWGGCPPGWIKYQDRCYKIMGLGGPADPRKNWQDAKAECMKTQGANLASIHSIEVQNYLTADMIEANDDVWIGMSALASGSQFVWTDSSSVDFVNWAVNQKDQTDFFPIGNALDCIRMMYDDHESGKWLDENCDALHAYLCLTKPNEIYPDTPISDNCTAVAGYTQYGDVCFKIYTDATRNFDDAKQKCEADGAGLASVMNGYEQAKLQSMMDDKGKPGSMWIGLYDDPATGVFVWLDGWPLHYDNWGWLDPLGLQYAIMREDGFLHEAGEWSNVNGAGIFNKYFTACKYNPGTPPPPEPTVVGYCEDGWSAFGSSCYIVGSGIFAQASFGEAVYDCDQNYGGAHVVAIGSKGENTFVKSLAQKEFLVNRVFIGIDRTDIGGWEWIDGSPLTFVNWGDDPDSNSGKDCAEMQFDAQAKWYHINCKSNSHYVCEKPKIPLATTQAPPLKNCSTGDTAWKEMDSYCYFVSLVYKSWHDAEEWCNQNGGNLASIHSAQENQFVLDLFPFRYQTAWIGYSKLFDGSGTDSYRWTDGSNPVDYTGWAVGEPDDQFGSQKCVNMGWAGTWDDNNCGATEGFACKKRSDSTAPITKPPLPPRAGNCRPGWSKAGSGCYLLKGEPADFKTWEDARAECRKETDGELASIHDQGVQSLLTSLIKSHTGHMWIGLRGGTSGWWGYHWADQSNVDYEHWALNQPSYFYDQTQCVVLVNDMDYPGRWDDQSCGDKHGYLCYQPLDPNMPTLAPPAGDCDLDGYENYYDDCFKLNATSIPFQNALSSCSVDGAYPASVVDGFDEAYLVTMLYARGLEAAWIGFAASNSSGKFVWADQRPDSYINWGPSQPSGPGNCAVLTTDAYWINVPCDEGYPFLCRINDQPFVPPTWPPALPGSCPDDWVPYGNNCYMFATGGGYVDWYEGFVKCSMDYGGAQLLSIHSRAENTFVQNNIDNLYSWTGVWLDLSRNKTAGNKMEFIWNDGLPLDYDNWRHDEPSQGGFFSKDCVIMMPGAYGKWETDGCSFGNGFACQKPKVPIPEGGCEKGWYRMNNWCYGAFGMFEPDTKTWPEAEVDCNSKGGNLATVYGQNVQSLLEGLMSEEKQSFAWIGLSKRSTGFFEWVDGTPFHFKNWAEDNPNQANGEYKCVRMNQEPMYPGLWSNIPCGSEDAPGKGSKGGYFCQKPADPAMPNYPGGNTCSRDGYYRFERLCYKAFFGSGQLKTFREAQDRCVADGATLPSVPNGYAEGFIETLLFYYDIKDSWIGLMKGADGQFAWINNDTSTFSNWETEPGQGDANNCARIKNRQVWEAVPCESKHNFICQISQTSPPLETTAAASNQTGLPTRPTAETYQGLGGGAVAGIVIGILVAVVLVLTLTYFLLRRSRGPLKAPEMGAPTISGFDNVLYSPNEGDVTFDPKGAGVTTDA